MNCTTITGESNFRHGQDDTAALRRCCRAFAHTVDQGGSEQVGAVGNWIGGGPAQRLVVLGRYAQIHSLPAVSYWQSSAAAPSPHTGAVAIFPDLVDERTKFSSHLLQAR